MHAATCCTMLIVHVQNNVFDDPLPNIYSVLWNNPGVRMIEVQICEGLHMYDLIKRENLVTSP